MTNLVDINERELAQIGGASPIGYTIGWISRACYDYLITHSFLEHFNFHKNTLKRKGF